MSPKGFLALTAATAVSIALAAGAIAERDVPLSASSVDEAFFPGLADRLDEVARIRTVVEGQSMTLERRDGGWVLAEKSGYPVDPQKVRELALGLATARLIEAKTSNPERLPRLDLGDPEAEGAKSQLVALETADGTRIAAAVIGKTKYGVYGPGRAGDYVRRADESQAWLSDTDVKVQSKAMDWLERDVVDVAAADLRRVILDAGGDTPIVMSRPTADAEALALEAVPEGREADPDKIERVADIVSRLTFQDVKPASELQSPSAPRTAVFETKDGLRIELDLTTVETAGEGDKKETEYWVTVDVAGDPSAASQVPAPASPEPSATVKAEAQAGADDAAGQGKEASSLEERVATLRKRVDGWAFELSPYLGERLTWAVDDLLKPTDKAS